jgi:hypothetical protein
LSSCLRPHARDAELPETLRPGASSAPPRRPRASDLSELSALLEGDELDLLRFGKSA